MMSALSYLGGHQGEESGAVPTHPSLTQGPLVGFSAPAWIIKGGITCLSLQLASPP